LPCYVYVMVMNWLFEWVINLQIVGMSRDVISLKCMTTYMSWHWSESTFNVNSYLCHVRSIVNTMEKMESNINLGVTFSLWCSKPFKKSSIPLYKSKLISPRENGIGSFMIELMLEIRIYKKWFIIVHYENTFLKC